MAGTVCGPGGPHRTPTLATVDGGTGISVLAHGLTAAAIIGFPRRRRRVSDPEPPTSGPVGLSEISTRLLDLLRDASIVIDSRDRILRASSSSVALGVVRDGRLEPPRLRQLVAVARADSEGHDVEIQVPRPRDKPISLQVRAASLGGGLVVLLVQDATEARKVEDVRRDFVANVSHELKTPIAALTLLAESVSLSSDDPVAVQRFAEHMSVEAERLATLVGELIDLSRVQSDDPFARGEAVRVDDVVRDAVERTRTRAGLRSIEIAVATVRGATVFGDRDQLASAVKNLVDNAVQYSPERTRVAVASRLTGDKVEISVTDQGLGIAEGDLDRIFERFYRVDPARSRATGGTGLGLSIVKHVVANHGGEITVWSREGEGSTFTMLLPAYHADDGPTTYASDIHGAATPATDPDNAKVVS